MVSAATAVVAELGPARYCRGQPGLAAARAAAVMGGFWWLRPGLSFAPAGAPSPAKIFGIGLHASPGPRTYLSRAAGEGGPGERGVRGAGERRLGCGAARDDA